MTEMKTMHHRPVGPHRVCVLEREPIAREGLRVLFEEASDFVLAGFLKQEVDLSGTLRKTTPDLLLIDFPLPGKSRLEMVRDLRRSYRSLQVVFFSAFADPFYAARSLHCGARGYVLRTALPEEIIRALRLVMSGDIYLPSTLTSDVLNLVALGGAQARGKVDVADLTDRELEVFAQVGWAKESQYIAEDLSVSVKTIEAHRASIRRKLKIRTRAELVRMAVLWNLEREDDTFEMP